MPALSTAIWGIALSISLEAVIKIRRALSLIVQILAHQQSDSSHKNTPLHNLLHGIRLFRRPTVRTPHQHVLNYELNLFIYKGISINKKLHRFSWLSFVIQPNR
jgi:hypothetical protein